MDLYNVFIFKSEWTYVTDCADFSSVLHGLQMAEYSKRENEFASIDDIEYNHNVGICFK